MPYLILAFVVLVLAIAYVKHLTVQAIYHVSHRVSGKPHLGIWLYALLFFPGTLIHELSHFFAAEIVRVHTGEVHLFPKREENYVTLGQVHVAKTDAVRAFFIGSAPFFVGLISLCAIVSLQFSSVIKEPMSLAFLSRSVLNSLGDPRSYLALYFAIVISHAMFLSENDRKEIIMVPVLLVLLGAIFFLLHGILTIPDRITHFLTNVLTLLNLSLLVVLIFNLLFLLLLTIIKKSFEKVF